jgi:predicted lactoylglutathione lyase
MPSTLHTPTNKLSESLTFYKKLGFTLVNESEPCLVSDGTALIEINPDRYARAGMKLYRPSWKDTVTQLQNYTHVTPTDNGFLLNDSSGTRIYLVEEEVILPANWKSAPASTLGNCAGLTLETADMETSVNIWKTLGFTNVQGTIEQGWILLINDEGTGVSLMPPNKCPHLFFNPSLSYFNGKDNLKVIDQIRKLNIPITEEITYFNKEGVVDNIIIRDPGGFGFFLFSD